jgi:hypothetical protein
MRRALPTVSLLILASLLPAPATAQEPAAKHRDAYVNIALSGKSCDVTLPAYDQAAKEAVAAGQPWWALSSALSSALCQQQAGRNADAVKTLAIAEKLGLDDCWLLRNTTLWNLRTDPTMQGILSRVRQAPADYHEVGWHQAEIRLILHDTSMMITENMNRKDSAWTVVPRSALPTRVTKSTGANVMRMLTHALQLHQQRTVMRSDQTRINHLTNLNIIRNLPGSRGGVDYHAIRMSQLQAQQRAQARAAAVQARAYRPGGHSTTPKACSQY